MGLGTSPSQARPVHAVVKVPVSVVELARTHSRYLPIIAVPFASCSPTTQYYLGLKVDKHLRQLRTDVTCP